MFASIYNKKLAEAGALESLASLFSPLIERVAADKVILDVAGLTLKEEIGETILRSAEEAGLKINVAIAANPDLSLCAAMHIDGLTVITAGKELEFIGNVSLDALGFSFPAFEMNLLLYNFKRRLEIIDMLKRWGLSNFRDFAMLPEVSVCERFGREGVLLQRFAQGRLTRPLLVSKPEPLFEESMEFDYPIDSLALLSPVIDKLIGKVCSLVKSYARAVQEIRLRMKLEDRPDYHRTISLPFPMVNERTLFKLLMLNIESHPPASAILQVGIAVSVTRPRSTQNELFERAAPEPEKLEITLARIATLVGPDNVGSPKLLDTHRPDAFCMERFKAPSPRSTTKKLSEGRALAADRLRLAIRMFRPPVLAMVEESSGLPVSLSARGLDLNGKVEKLAGPWRSSGDWWNEIAWEREEWDIALNNGAVYRVYFDLRRSAWFVEGVYD